MLNLIKYIPNETRFIVSSLVIFFATIIIVFIFNRAANRFIKKNTAREDFDPTNYRFIQHTVTALVILVGFSFIIYMIPALRHVAQSLVAGAGILAVILGFASQQALANVISGIFIVVSKPYRIKDRITIKDIQSGVVEDITLRHTVIRNFENKRIIIPNSVMNNEVVVNSNYEEDRICRFIEMSIAYDADIDKAKAIMADECEKHPFLIDVRTPEDIEKGNPKIPVRVLSLGDFSVNLRAWAWASNPLDAFVMGCDLLESIKKRFDREGIEIPFPYRTVVYKRDLQEKTSSEDRTEE